MSLEAIANSAGSLSDKEIDKLIRLLQKKKKVQVVWKDNNTILNEYEIRTDKKWFKLLVAENNSTKQKYLRAYRAGQSLSIMTRDEFTRFMTHLKTGAINLNWYNAEDVDILQNLDDYITKNRDQQEKIQNLRQTMSGLRERIINMDISQFEESLKKFKELYSNDHEEKDIQGFLATNTWILGDEYVYQQPEFFAQFPMWKDKLDFFVKRYDGFYDIIEIKKANAKLFVGLTDSTDLYSPTRESPMADDLKNAISQLMNYLEEANIFRQAIHEINKNVTIHKPRGFIVIGRNDPKYDKAITTINDYLSGIQILTYDQLYQKAMGFVTRIKKGHV